MLFPALSFAQQNPNGSRFHTIVSGGMMAGESIAKPLFQLSAGWTHHQRWFTGIGTGIDLYNLRSIPLFADGRMSLGKKQSFFVYANAGYNFPVGNKNDAEDYFKITDKFYGGFYWDAGAGYNLRLHAMHRLSLSAGYSYKKLSNKTGYGFTCPGGNCPEQIYIYHYYMGRIAAKLGWEIGR